MGGASPSKFDLMNQPYCSSSGTPLRCSCGEHLTFIRFDLSDVLLLNIVCKCCAMQQFDAPPKTNQRCLRQQSSDAVDEPNVLPLRGDGRARSAFCICHISSSSRWPQCVQDTLAHKGQIDTQEPGGGDGALWEMASRGHLEQARPTPPPPSPPTPMC